MVRLVSPAPKRRRPEGKAPLKKSSGLGPLAPAGRTAQLTALAELVSPVRVTVKAKLELAWCPSGRTAVVALIAREGGTVGGFGGSGG
jgi:hypothetical protein